MKGEPLTKEEIARRVKVWLDCGMSSQKAAKELKLNRRNFDRFLDRHAEALKKQSLGQLEQTDIVTEPLPKTGCKRYLLTCAQNSTKAHDGFWRNLVAFAEHVEADIKVSAFSYNKNALNTKNEKPEGGSKVDVGDWYAPEVRPYVTNDLISLAPTLAFCANLQILPTAVNPVSGLQDYTGEASSVIPHVKVRMEPVPTSRDKPTKHLYTTGTCTLKNYIQQKAGQKAEFHHVFGALLVEVLPDGRWFARQITADKNGDFDDAGTQVSMRKGKAEALESVKVIQWGDIHVANIDTTVAATCWGKGGILDTLKPSYQIFHDLVDGESHNPHELKNHHRQYQLHKGGHNSISDEYAEARDFLDSEAHRDWCESIVIWSNHDEFLRRYLASTDYRRDHVNATFILWLEHEAYKAMDEGREPDIFARALESATAKVYSDDHDSLVIAGINWTHHGHVGANGSRGSVAQFAKYGAKTATGHSHGAWVISGATSAGTCSKLNLGYNKGFSSWSHTQTVAFESGKRQQITIDSKGDWRA